MEKETIKIPGWKIIRTIGKGGFGYVYEVEKEDDFSGGVHSALKVVSIPDSQSEIADLRMEGYDNQSMTELFRSHVEDITSEFRLMSKLKGCSNIVSFEDYSVVQHDNDPGYDVMIRMELLTPLPEYIYRHYEKEPITDALVRKIGTDICNALELCHDCSIIHRDIKPQNIFVNAYGSFKLGDFGIAKTSDHTTRATKTGTFGYMAPEVYLSKPYNASVDIYSLGLVMYWMLNERRGPFLPLPPAVPKPSQNAEALDRRMTGEPLPVPKHGSEELKRIVLKACAFDPKDRYANPTEMKRDLERLTVETYAEEPHAETEQASIPFSADEDEKTFGVFGGKPSKPEVSPTEEDEKTFGIFDTCQPKEPEFIPADSEATVSAKKAAPMKPAEKPVEHKKEIKPVEPKKEIKPIKTEPEQKEQPVQAEEKPVETKSRKKKSKLPVILSIAAAVVIAAVVLIVVLAGKGKTPTPKPTVDPVVVFHDETFENAIREKCGFAGTIYQSDILSVTELDLSFNQISDITSLSGLTKLERLYLYNNQISDITALRGLTKLEELWLDGNQISDISALSGLTNLRNLDLSHNQISDISALSGLTNLRNLSLSYNQISDISALSGLTNLEQLWLDGNQISDISALNGLTSLTQLSLYHNPLSQNQIDELQAKLPNCQIYY